VVNAFQFKYRWSEFIGVFRNPFAIGCTGIKQLKNNVVSVCSRLLGIANYIKLKGGMSHSYVNKN